jgi:hypothetical protein
VRANIRLYSVHPQTPTNPKLPPNAFPLPNTQRKDVIQQRKVTSYRYRFLIRGDNHWLGKLNLLLVIVRLDEFEVCIPLVPDHLRHTKKPKKFDGLDPIEKTTTLLLNPGERNREPAGAPRHGSEAGAKVGEKAERGGGSCDTLPHVKQRTGMIIFAAAGRMGSPVAGRDGVGFLRGFPLFITFRFYRDGLFYL